MYGSFQPTLPAGKAELVRGAEELHVTGRAERTSCVQRLGVLSRIQKQEIIFIHIVQSLQSLHKRLDQST